MIQYIQVQAAQLIHYEVKTNRVYINYCGYTIISQKANKRNCIFGQYQYYIFVQPNDTASTDTHEIQHIGLKSTNSSYAPEIYDAIVQRHDLSCVISAQTGAGVHLVTSDVYQPTAASASTNN